MKVSNRLFAEILVGLVVLFFAAVGFIKFGRAPEFIFDAAGYIMIAVAMDLLIWGAWIISRYIRPAYVWSVLAVVIMAIGIIFFCGITAGFSTITGSVIIRMVIWVVLCSTLIIYFVSMKPIPIGPEDHTRAWKKIREAASKKNLRRIN